MAKLKLGDSIHGFGQLPYESFYDCLDRNKCNIFTRYIIRDAVLSRHGKDCSWYRFGVLTSNLIIALYGE